MLHFGRELVDCGDPPLQRQRSLPAVTVAGTALTGAVGAAKRKADASPFASTATAQSARA